MFLLHIQIAVLPPSWLSLPTILPSFLHSLLLWEGGGPPVHSPPWHMKPLQGQMNSLLLSPDKEEHIQQKGNSFWNSPHASIIQYPHEDPATHLLYMWRSSSCMLFGWWFRLWEPQGSRFVDSLDLPVKFLNLFPNSFERLPKLHLLLVCGSLNLLESAARWSFSEDSYARLLYVTITKYH